MCPYLFFFEKIYKIGCDIKKINHIKTVKIQTANQSF